MPGAFGVKGAVGDGETAQTIDRSGTVTLAADQRIDTNQNKATKTTATKKYDGVPRRDSSPEN